ncbi:MAG: hypothetical protein VX255_18350 [Candidatus Latescibacterota bacterium]|nr:hypothetical protein [Candidatus Latescibacterota bacterium]
MATETQGLTVEAWVDIDEDRAEAVQTAVAQWSFADSMDRFATYDAGSTGGLPTQGFFGAVYARGHVYFSPQCNNVGRHGIALRVAVSKPFDDSASWESYDGGATGGLQTRGYYGCLATGRYVYYVPRTDGQHMHSRVLRYDMQSEFSDETSWSAFDPGEPISHQGGAFDGRYVYFAPGYHQDDGRSGQVLRHDTTAPFDEPSSWVRFDVGAHVGERCLCYDGAVFDGRHVYFVPLDGGDMLRFDTTSPFENGESWESFDPRGLFSSGESGGCVGAIFDGRYIYYTPYAHSTVVRFDSSSAFTDSGGWSTYDAGSTSGLTCCGYDGAAFDGRFVYFIPFWEGDSAAHGFHARLLRLDTLKNFDDASAWSAADGSALASPNPGGFNGGAFDGRYLYMAPWRQNEPSGEIHAHGQVLRYDTASSGSRFQLRWMDCGHNGGLGGSVPGPAFVLNTEAGVVSVQAHTIPAAGKHHLAGVVTADRVALWVDGTCIASAALPSPVVDSQLDISVGQLAGGSSPLQGRVLKHRISDCALDQDWLEKAPSLLSDEHALRGLS